MPKPAPDPLFVDVMHGVLPSLFKDLQSVFEDVKDGNLDSILDVVESNVDPNGDVALIGGGVARSLAWIFHANSLEDLDRVFPSRPPDLDFVLLDDPRDFLNLDLPIGWDERDNRNMFGGVKIMTPFRGSDPRRPNKRMEIDFAFIEQFSELNRNVHTLEQLFEGTPLNVQAVAAQFGTQQIVGPGIEAVRSGVVRVNNHDRLVAHATRATRVQRAYAIRNEKPIPRPITPKSIVLRAAQSYGFDADLTGL